MTTLEAPNRPPSEFYDHASNHTNAAQAHAVARARRASLRSGDAWRVEFSWPSSQNSCWWDGCRYDAIQLARELRLNGAAVSLSSPSGKTWEMDEVLDLRY